MGLDRPESFDLLGGAMVVVLVITESGLMPGTEEYAPKSYVRIPKLPLRTAVKLIRERFPGYIDHNRFIVPVQVPQEPDQVAEEIDQLLHHAMDKGERSTAFVPVSAASAADRIGV